MTVDHINVEASIKQVKDLMAAEGNISPALKASIEVLLLLISILVSRLGLNSKNSSKPPSTTPIALKNPEKLANVSLEDSRDIKGKPFKSLKTRMKSRLFRWIGTPCRRANTGKQGMKPDR